MNSHTIARNSFWFGLETVVGLVSGVVTSIIIARALGPVKLGHYTYIAWLVSITASVGALGVPAATFKYMGEYLGRGEAALAKAIFISTFRLQATIASILTVVAVSVAWFGADHDMRWTAAALAAAMWPAMVNAIPSQANMANENLVANVPGALVSNAIYVGGVILTLSFSRSTLGLAITLLTMRTAELLIRVGPVLRWMESIPHAEVPVDIRRRLFAFSRQSTVLLLLSIIVWDRSEVIFLRYLTDIRQLAFYTVVFNVTERLRSVPQAFSTAVGATMMAQFGRNQRALLDVFGTSVRYLLFFCAPIHVGLSLLSGPVITLTYGSKYLPAIPLMAMASLLALPRVVLTPVNTLLAATDKQALTVRLNLWMALLNIGLDVLLIRHYGAMGAVIANGLSQTIAAICLYWLASNALSFHFPWIDLVKVLGVSAAMTASVLVVPSTSSLLLDLLARTGVGAAVYILGVRATRLLAKPDGRRLLQLGARFPSALRSAFNRGVQFLVPSLGAVGL